MLPQQPNPAQQGQPAAAPAAPGAMPGAAPQGGAPGPDLGFNQQVYQIVMSRIQTMTPEEEQVLDSVISPQTLPVFLKILPELKPLLDLMSQGGEGQQGPISADGGGAEERNPLSADVPPGVSKGLVG